jgi:hypothetical protein
MSKNRIQGCIHFPLAIMAAMTHSRGIPNAATKGLKLSFNDFSNISLVLFPIFSRADSKAWEGVPLIVSV